jgi:uncharacterized protein (UPF0332 family)
MADADDLLQLARELANLHPNEAHQASLRRALSTAYYALFHLLIADAVAGCADPQLRVVLSRMFDHASMRRASDSKISELKGFFKDRPLHGPEYALKDHLYTVAETFSEAHFNRHEADYNLVREWQPTEVSLLIERVADAFSRWHIIRGEQPARSYLISMLPSRDTKQPDKARPDRRQTELPKSS